MIMMIILIMIIAITAIIAVIAIISNNWFDRALLSVIYMHVQTLMLTQGLGGALWIRNTNSSRAQ